MIQITLEGLKFHSKHGLHAEEALTGSDFEVTLNAAYSPSSSPVEHIHQTVDYTLLYALVKKRMEQPTALLESIATDIAVSVLAQFDLVEQVNISIKKLNPPIINFQGSVGVCYELKRNQ